MSEILPAPARVRQALLAGTALVPLALVALLGAVPARADCAQTGSNVNCTGTDADGFAAAASNLNVTVQSGATVLHNAGTGVALDLLATNVVVNNGTIGNGSNSTAGVVATNDNVVTNNGAIAVGDDSAGIVVNNRNTIINNNSIVAANTNSIGIGGNNFTNVTNNGSIVVGNDGTVGILINSDGSITNNNLIQTGNDGTTGFVANSRNTIINNGTMLLGTNSVGMDLNNDNTVVNNGLIQLPSNTGGLSVAIAASNNNQITNNGSLILGDLGVGILIGRNNTVTNNNIISVGQNGTGIWATGLTGNTINNSGAITGGAGSTGVAIESDASTVNNSGTIRMTGGVFAVNFCFCVTGGTINNSGTLDGRVWMEGAGTIVMNNSGFMGITDTLAGTPVDPVDPSFKFDGTFNQSPTGILSLRGDNTGVADRLNANAASLSGTLRLAVQPGLYTTPITYADVVQTTTPTTTRFTSVAASSPFFALTSIYDTGNPNSYTSLSLLMTRIPFGAVPGATPNQAAVGNGLELAYATPPTGNAATFFSNLFQVTSLAALDQLSGQGITAMQNGSFTVGSQFVGSMLTQFLNNGASNGVSMSAPAYAAADPAPRGHEAFAALKAPPASAPPSRWRLWMLGFGSHQRIDGDANSAGQSVRGGGGSFGVEHRFGNGAIAGIALGGSESNVSVDQLATSGRITGAHLGAYAFKAWGAYYAAAAVSYARFSNSTTRTITAFGGSEIATGRFDSNLFASRFELGWRQPYANVTVTPFIAVEPSVLRQDGYTETSTGITGLTVAQRTTASLPTFLGAQIQSSHAVGAGATLTPFVRVAWVHEFLPNRQIAASFVTVPAAGFTVAGARPASDGARVDAGARLALNRSVALFANFNGEFSDRSTYYGGNGGLRVAW